MKKFIYKNSLALSVIWAFTIFILCATPGQYIPSVSWLELLSFDKWVHAGMFFILCSLLFTYGIKSSKTKLIFFIYFIGCVAYGGSLEIMQAKFFSNRSGDWQDFVANTFGSLMAVLLYKKMGKVFKAVEG